ncbi:CYTH and CHAD domain-containing protein [Blastococcus haudaquaticus]|uniref:Inorganic triphosphatase YgiF, contains CYTH and CHAD domains n=1 Tax=Blastococcus haudaquaticus TaxID=1938745 RepID=A0A286GKS5_9ACTN|nr:CYTH and CHAD domain-containing protein [Blastococcus haudaquaticus]SOD95689.1 Inorganic triphosphatase YgiF, contains CYTH and CHAD domains [Blastococcus haudaquaticus]
MTSGHLEIETKYDVAEGFTLPSLDGLDGVGQVSGPVEHGLEAVYHDTADLRLLRARVTLRRRTGGPDAGWHLKLPAGTARRELHAPLGRAVKKPPQTLAAPVAGLLRGARTAPVATLRTRRQVTALRDDAGRLLAEVADDMVTATVPAVAPGEPAELHTWREIEVELGDGDPDAAAAVAAAVGERLAAAGAHPSASASKVGRVLASRLAAVVPPPAKRRKKGPRAGEFVTVALAEQVALLQAADVALRTDQPDAVHQLRVGSRRLRSSLAALRIVLDRQATDPLREELAWLGGQLAQARDDEVALAHLRELVAEQPAELVLGPVAARLQQLQVKDEQAGLDRARDTLSDQRYLRLLDALHALVSDPPLLERADERIEAVLRDAVGHSVRRLRRRMKVAEDARGAGNDEPLHDVRKAAKGVRYVTEIARAEVGGLKDVVRAAKRVQEVLGVLQDTTVTRELCRRLAVVAFAAGENGFTFGRLHALEQARAERAEQEFWKIEPELRRVLKDAAS